VTGTLDGLQTVPSVTGFAAATGPARQRSSAVIPERVASQVLATKSGKWNGLASTHRGRNPDYAWVRPIECESKGPPNVRTRDIA
jgi:hypothetical protein